MDKVYTFLFLRKNNSNFEEEVDGIDIEWTVHALNTCINILNIVSKK